MASCSSGVSVPVRAFAANLCIRSLSAWGKSILRMARAASDESLGRSQDAAPYGRFSSGSACALHRCFLQLHD
jgi:hypothetical protein